MANPARRRWREPISGRASSAFIPVSSHHHGVPVFPVKRPVEDSSASYLDLRSKRNNLESEFLFPEIRSGIIALAMVAKVIPLPPYPSANCAPGKSLWGPM